LRFREWRDRVAAIGEKRLLPRALLCDVQRRAARPDRDDLGRGVGGVRRHVLEFEGDDVDAAGEGADGAEIVVVGADFEVGHLSGRRIDAG
jgi:hypothetical protein